MICHVASGRMSEPLGRLGDKLDRALRLLNLRLVAARIADILPADMQVRLEALVAGVNHAVRRLPYFVSEFRVLPGGQDGWAGSTTMADQVVLWRRGEDGLAPLRVKTVRVRFPFPTELQP